MKLEVKYDTEFGTDITLTAGELPVTGEHSSGVVITIKDDADDTNTDAYLTYEDLDNLVRLMTDFAVIIKNSKAILEIS